MDEVAALNRGALVEEKFACTVGTIQQAWTFNGASDGKSQVVLLPEDVIGQTPPIGEQSSLA